MNPNVDMRAHLSNLLNALLNISPSRNLIAQMILLLPIELHVIWYSYPEINYPEARSILKAIGIEFEEEVKRIKDSFAETLYRHIHNTFDWLDDELIYKESASFGHYGFIDVEKKMEDIRISLAKLLGCDIDSIPNPYEEWCRLVLKKLRDMSYGSKHINILRKILSQDDPLTSKKIEDLKNEVKAQVNISPDKVEDIFKLIIADPRKSEYLDTTEIGDTKINKYLEHSIYHLDLLLKTYTYHTGYYERYSYQYSLRHKETLRKILVGEEGE